MPAPMNPDDREELVAYLDGEVSEEKALVIENQLSLDPTVRAEAESLKRTWDLLDHLPKPEASPNFTNKTLDRLSVQETRAALARSSGPRRWLRIAGWAAALLLFAAGGYLVTRTALRPATDETAENNIRPKPTETDLVRELRIIDNLRHYEQIDSMEYLRELDQRDLFGEDLDS